jgi:quercetin dioxygenase-like cupin family protein/DNA-binding XRE family transcriptional regulator
LINILAENQGADMNVSRRIQKMREVQEMTVDQVAELTGISADYIRQIEANQETPSIGAVVKISRALGTRMGQLLHSTGAAGSDIFSICRAGEAQEAERSTGASGKLNQGYSYMSLLTPDVRGHGMEPFLVTFDPKSADTVEPTVHEGEEFIYVLSGSIELVYSDKSYLLGPGDSLYIDSSKPHAVRASGDEPPTVVAIVYQRS